MVRKTLARANVGLPVAAALAALLALFPGSPGRAAQMEAELPLVEPGPLLLTIPSVEEPAAAPLAQVQALGEGRASYYGRAFAGRRTASGETFNPGELTAAHRTLPFGSKVMVTDVSSGRSVVVRINDRGPFTHGRLIDLSEAAARELGLISRGTGQVRLALMDQATSR